MKPTENVTRAQKAEGADLIMEQGFVTERDEPAMMDATWCAEFLPQVNDELRLRTLPNRAVMRQFHYYMGTGVILFDPTQLSEAQAKDTLQHALGYHK
ncbi:hypothetical protein [Lacticaseibacillus daqingensis]|uniref:hypothetical protein n=1 Tax=Lacticaseibacillus daqingensis TaxID=2486014 RepID=UPI000F781129|nr:hypothetical protein [Lacticaseibacillus daqingensis]